MKSPHALEEYECKRCKITIKRYEINPKTWKCKSCDNPISIKWTVDGFVHNCHRLFPHEAEEGYSVVMGNNDTYLILNISRSGENVYRVALKNWGVIKVNASDFLMVINGGWY